MRLYADILRYKGAALEQDLVDRDAYRRLVQGGDSGLKQLGDRLASADRAFTETLFVPAPSDREEARRNQLEQLFERRSALRTELVRASRTSGRPVRRRPNSQDGRRLSRAGMGHRHSRSAWRSRRRRYPMPCPRALCSSISVESFAPGRRMNGKHPCWRAFPRMDSPYKSYRWANWNRFRRRSSPGGAPSGEPPTEPRPSSPSSFESWSGIACPRSSTRHRSCC